MSGYKNMSRSGLVLSAVALSVACFVFVFQTGSAQELGSGGIGGRPAFPRDDNPRSESIFIHTIEAGNSVEDGILLVNNTDEERTIQVYAADALVSSGGAFGCEQLAEDSDDVGAWIQLAEDEVVVPPAGNRVVDFSITVPENTDVGEHDGCVVVQEKKPVAENEQGIGLSFRTAIRVAILVPGNINKDIEIVDFGSSIKPNDIILTPVIENRGNVSVDADIQTNIDYFFGANFSQAGGSFPVLRGQTGEWNLRHERPFWGGFYRAELTVSYNDNIDEFLGEGSDQSVTLNYGSKWLFVIPHPLAAAVELLVLFVLGFGVWRIRRQLAIRKRIKRDWHTYTVKSGDDIETLATRQQVDWRLLAKANSLKAPYKLQAGQKLKVPKKAGADKAKSKSKSIDGIN